MNFGKFYFKEIGENEQIIMVIHRHWFNIFQQFLVSLALVAALLGGIFFFPALFYGFTSKDAYRLFFFIESLFFLLIWLYMFLIWLDYYLDVWIITSERIVNIEQKGLFARHVSELKIKNIQDITTEVEGLIPTMLNYGDVYVQTAAEQVRFIFRSVPDPYRIKSEISKLQKRSFPKTKF